MKNWGYIRQNMKAGAKQSLQQNMLLCLKVTLTAILAQVMLNWLAGSLSVPMELVMDQTKPVHSLVALFTNAAPAALAMTLILELAAIFLTAPLEVGTSGLYLDIVRKQGQEGEKLKYKSIFDWYMKIEKSIKAFLLMLLIRLLTLLWVLVFCSLPLAALYIHENTAQTNDAAQLPPSYLGTLLILSLLFLAGFIFAAVRFFAYAPAPYLMAQDPGLGVAGAVAKSRRLMCGHLWEYFMLELSFIPWYILTVFTFGVSLLYFIPYRSACQAVFIRKRQFEKLVEQNAIKPADGQHETA